jgi:D-lactate dehydrogenase
MAGFGCHLLIHDPAPIANLPDGARQVELDQLLEGSDIISLHCPLNTATHHLINAARLQQMQRGAMLINTGRGALIDTPALIGALKSGQLGYLGLDVYEEEAELFFEDCSERPLQDDVLARLLSFSNVLITAHQAFLTYEALAAIAETTHDNITAWLAGAPINQLLPDA